jgi:hypothetical protein
VCKIAFQSLSEKHDHIRSLTGNYGFGEMNHGCRDVQRTEAEDCMPQGSSENWANQKLRSTWDKDFGIHMKRCKLLQGLTSGKNEFRDISPIHGKVG